MGLCWVTRGHEPWPKAGWIYTDYNTETHGNGPETSVGWGLPLSGSPVCLPRDLVLLIPTTWRMCGVPTTALGWGNWGVKGWRPSGTCGMWGGVCSWQHCTVTNSNFRFVISLKAALNLPMYSLSKTETISKSPDKECWSLNHPVKFERTVIISSRENL